MGITVIVGGSERAGERYFDLLESGEVDGFGLFDSGGVGDRTVVVKRSGIEALREMTG